MSLMRFAATALLLALTTLVGGSLQPAAAFWTGSKDVLVEIDGQRFTRDDFARWWEQWQEPGMAFPESPREYIDWLLLAREAEQLELYDKPRFREKVETFLKVRSLMRLQQEEVAERVSPPGPEDLRRLYLEEYAPQVNLHLVALSTEEGVRKMQAALAAGSLPTAAEQVGVNNQEQQMKETGWLRPFSIPDPLRKAATTLEPGSVGGPFLWQDVWYFLQVVNKKAGNEEDMEQFREILTEKYRKKEADRLTRELLDRLKKNYQVTVDRDLLEKIDPEKIPQGAAGKTVVRIEKHAITAGEFQQILQQEARLRGKGHGDELAGLRRGIANRMVEQTLLSLESRARKYENSPPFVYTYQFYRRHRLVRELEAEMIWPRVQVNEKEIETEYRLHPERYLRSPEGVVELARVETGDPKLAALLQEKLQRGEHFSSVMNLASPAGPEISKVPLGHLEPSLRQAVKRLAPGQSSAGIAVGEKIVFVKVLARIDQDVLPLAAVTEAIRRQLAEEKFNQIRQELLARLRDHSAIRIDGGGWKKVVNTLRSRP